jgi:hypothetical protein
VESNYLFVDALSFLPNPTACFFAESAPLAPTEFAISRADRVLTVTSAAAISARFATSRLFVGSVRTSSTDHLRHSTIFLKESISASASILRQAGGGTATRITLGAIASFVLLAAVGAIVFVLFRRQSALLTNTQTTTSGQVTENVEFLGSRNSTGSPTADLAEFETLDSNHETEENPCPCEKNEGDHESTFTDSPYLPAEVEKLPGEN